MPRLISIILGLCHFIIKISIVLIVLFFSIIYQFLNKCKICGNEYTNIEKWCKPCQINNLTKFFTNSEIEKIGRLIQEMQRNIDRPSDIIFEWIPYDQFENIKELDKSVNVHSAIWKDGPLYYKDRIIFSEKKYVREQNKSVILKCLYNSRIITNVFLNEVKLYHSKNNNNHHMPRLYGITQDPKTKDYILIDGIIQQMRLNYNNLNDILFEWIPYDQFNNVNVIIRENELVTIYSAIWSNGPLHYDIHKSKYMRNKNEKVLLKCLFNSHNILDKFLNELKASSHKIYGVSQDPDTNDYIIVFIDGFHCQNCGKLFTQVYNKWCKPCQLSHLKNTLFLNGYHLNSLTILKKIKNDVTTMSSAIWKDGPLYYDNNKYEYARKQNTKIILKHLCNSRNITNAFLNKIESYYLSNHNSYMPEVLYGISRNPDTKDYILVFKTTAIRHAVKIFTNWTSGNEKIDDLIQEMQLSFNEQSDVLFEWIPYNQFNNVKVIRDDEFSTTRSAIWSDGPLYYDTYKFKYTRNKNESVILKSPHNSQNIDEFLNEIKSSPLKMYGISQNSDSNYFIVVRDECRCDKCGKLFTDTNLKLCKPCQRRCLKNITIWTSRNEKINKLIQKIQSKINMAFEWIPYNQFKNVKEIGKNVRVNKAIWRDGPLYYDNIKGEYERSRNEEVYLKCLYGSRNFTHISDIFLNEVTSYYSNNQYYSVPGIYGISQNPVTNDYMLVFQYCKPIAIRNQNKKVNLKRLDEIELASLIKTYGVTQKSDTKDYFIVFQNECDCEKCGISVRVCSAIWKDGPLYYDNDKYEYTRCQNEVVALKCLYNSQNIVNVVLNEV
ncbi:kinase-like domain-containing protein [Rhizophagus clarus]|uniref:Kinase-like domain-containing protein n=1 Tax=Rhizophagus clarus TaxID=94130 RepID=A0A8H3QW54_9GLOM|nr:kinase-like domain-containing protein [Rhizophagus clarus]